MPPPLTLTGNVLVDPDPDSLYDDLAKILLGAAVSAVGKRGVFHLALSGGSTPEPFYMRLVTDPRFRGLPWKETHAWMVDERRVPEDDPKSNYRMIRETLLDHVPMRRRQRHPMPVLADDPTGAYERELATAVIGKGSAAGGAPPRLDFVLLGMGDDGHTASLFPGSPALGETQRWVAVNEGPRVTPPPRLTLTYPILNAARQVAVLVTGAKKSDTLRRVARQLTAGGPDPETLPITGVRPTEGDLVWFLDADAAGVSEEEAAAEAERAGRSHRRRRELDWTGELPTDADETA